MSAMPSSFSGPHATEIAVVAKSLGVDPSRGLGSHEVAQRLTDYGPNTLQRIRSRPAWRVLVDQFASLIIALLAAGPDRVAYARHCRSHRHSGRAGAQCADWLCGGMGSRTRA